MAHIISRAERITITEYTHGFEWRTSAGSGFSFECTPDGTLLAPTPRSLENYRKCIDGTYDVVDKGVITWTRSYTEPAVLECDCGRTVALDGFTNTCSCGADYNYGGMRLAPRHLWGEEEGITADEIIRETSDLEGVWCD